MTGAAQTPMVYVAVVGVGLVGAEFISQLLSLAPRVSRFRLISLTSSTRTLYCPDQPITDPSSWKSLLANSARKPDLQVLTSQLAGLLSQTQRVAIVDNTSSDEVASMYPTWLQHGIDVITPNKKGVSGSVSLYESIIDATQKSGAKFLNESTVGAGLPIISTLKDLVTTGDKVAFNPATTRKHGL
jgi:homoserine dehydrogenase